MDGRNGDCGGAYHLDGEEQRRRRGVVLTWWSGRGGGVVERRRLAMETTGWRRHESGGGERAPRGKGVARVEMSRVCGLPNGVGLFGPD
jgi:hypothetical protein